jgi:hypothetical protein
MMSAMPMSVRTNFFLWQRNSDVVLQRPANGHVATRNGLMDSD